MVPCDSSKLAVLRGSFETCPLRSRLPPGVRKLLGHEADHLSGRRGHRQAGGSWEGPADPPVLGCLPALQLDQEEGLHPGAAPPRA
eukprot:6335362-Pyramimonas_sp.AAC.1